MHLKMLPEAKTEWQYALRQRHGERENKGNVAQFVDQGLAPASDRVDMDCCLWEAALFNAAAASGGM